MPGITLDALCSELIVNDDFIILTHTHPDPDTLGSALALAETLRSMGKRASAICPETPSAKLVCLMGGYDFSYSGDAGYNGYIISVDVASASMLGRYSCLSDKVSLMIDHHLPRSPLCDKTYVYPEAAACGELIYGIICRLQSLCKATLTKEIASYLYCAISSDTGGFIFSNTTPQTHIIAAELLKFGFNAAELDEAMHIKKPLALCRAEKYLFERLRFYCGGRLGIVALTAKEREGLSLSDNELGDIVDIARQVDCVDIAVSVRELAQGEYKASMRSRYADVSVAASEFGGGGHKKAAGCTVRTDSIEDAIAQVVAVCEKILAKD